MPSGSEETAHQNACPHTDTGYSKYDDIHNRPRRSQGGQRFFSYKTAGDNGIYRIISQLEQIPHNQRDRIPDQMPCNAPFCHIQSCHVPPPFP